MVERIRGLTLIRPWAWAIACAGKDVENRTWEPPRAMVGGWLAIHAGKKWDQDAADSIADTFGIKVPGESEQPSGVIIAMARIAGVVRDSESPWFCGPVGWTLDQVVQLQTPVACRGAQGLWTLPEPVLERVHAGWAAARGARP
ncbi:hypothetical protein JKA73_17385 [Myxococcus xanthus]|uniref:hypothetical protein n=1 Tax=Myxococcus xanthus TaxID=34 RepID=UPI00191725D5|nr:hypothetical protein [Myxococcus xanthus]QQR47709.1 hypothetical protein JKA73_17385 [Myxococcus xanthus]